MHPPISFPYPNALASMKVSKTLHPAISNGVPYKTSLVEKIQNVQCILQYPWNFVGTFGHMEFSGWFSKGFSLNNNEDKFLGINISRF